MPVFDPNELFDCFKHLVDMDKGWFPEGLDNPG
jgi:hypothetical protein